MSETTQWLGRQREPRRHARFRSGQRHRRFLVVGGDINAVVNLNNGSAQIGGAVNGTLNSNGSGAMQVGVAGIPTADITSLLQNLSTDLASNPDTLAAPPTPPTRTMSTSSAARAMQTEFSSSTSPARCWPAAP
ncbi:MAG: hypothetical protein H6844_14615 [Alphaproteobacteria bacterium]|nr:hypothetical protein [Alphaproteobacteria bacterium]